MVFDLSDVRNFSSFNFFIFFPLNVVGAVYITNFSRVQATTFALQAYLRGPCAPYFFCTYV